MFPEHGRQEGDGRGWGKSRWQVTKKPSALTLSETGSSILVTNKIRKVKGNWPKCFSL